MRYDYDYYYCHYDYLYAPKRVYVLNRFSRLNMYAMLRCLRLYHLSAIKKMRRSFMCILTVGDIKQPCRY